jgi:hypothetical protein
LEEQTLPLIALVKAGLANDIAAWRRPVILVSRTLATMTSEVDHRRLELAWLAKKIVWLCGPPRHELEAISVAAALELQVNRPRLSAERETIGSERIGGDEQDGVRFHLGPWRPDRVSG